MKVTEIKPAFTPITIEVIFESKDEMLRLRDVLRREIKELGESNSILDFLNTQV